ncbi:hypothetical protein BGP_3019 [Beggiatoa sp. PS]|nr:hypothetical protein BGP_3019 [Beggiatoa sp. PS]
MDRFPFFVSFLRKKRFLKILLYSSGTTIAFLFIAIFFDIAIC